MSAPLPLLQRVRKLLADLNAHHLDDPADVALIEEIDGHLAVPQYDLLEASRALLDTMETPRTDKATLAWLRLMEAVAYADTAAKMAVRS